VTDIKLEPSKRIKPFFLITTSLLAILGWFILKLVIEVNHQYAIHNFLQCLTESNQSWTLGYTFRQNTDFMAGVFVEDSNICFFISWVAKPLIFNAEQKYWFGHMEFRAPYQKGPIF
jgi:hypothetical protein